ncbi:MAG: hypothetical protein EXR49_05780 [Dehalococcoidia bacterium]|nr:hypothetical protein [Dehalococcoidia bacterium]
MRYFDRTQVDRPFNARTLAIIGASKENGFYWLKRYPAYAGKLYSVHTNLESAKAIEALGIRNYRSIGEIPEPVDYVVGNVPRRAAVEVLAQCIAAKAGGVSFYTSGFAEMDAEGAALQATMANMSRESGVPLFGPNGLGVYSPSVGIVPFDGLPRGEGAVGMVGQSGTHSSYFTKSLYRWHGIRLGRGVSMGNGAALDAADWMEYIGEDARVRIVGAYLEGIGERGRGDYHRFIEAVRRVSSKKPVIIWKGGNTEDGSRVTALHTGSARVTAAEWEHVLGSAGAMGVESMEQLVDTVSVVHKLREAAGPRAGLMVLTGGQGIAVTDALARRGLRVPRLSPRSLAELGTFFNVVGGSCENPLDSAYMVGTPEAMSRLLGILEADENTDFVCLDLFGQTVSKMSSVRGLGAAGAITPGAPGEATYVDAVAAHAAKAAKPFFVIITASDQEREALDLRDVFKNRGVMTFSSAERAATAMARGLEWWRGRRLAGA